VTLRTSARSGGKLEGAPGQGAAGASGGRADIQLDLAKGSTSDHQPKYTTKFVTTHKAPCRCLVMPAAPG
jgi:hypothetical protein